MSFLDEPDDPPRRSSSGRSRADAAAIDSQTLLVRRLVAGGVGLLVLLLLFFGIRGCLNAQKEQALKDYVQDATALTEESNGESESMFGLFRDPGDQSPVDLQESLNGFRSQAAQLVDRARDIDRPDELARAQESLVTVLEFRRDGIAGIARELRTALGDEGRSEATARIAAQMQNFLTSDVIFSQRFVPQLQAPLRQERLLDDLALPESQFLPDIDWLRPRTVATRIASVRGGEGGGRRAATPGLHGTGLGTVTVEPGGTALQAGGAAADIRVSEDLAFKVQVSNQGENEERDVTAKVRISGAGRPIELEERLDTIAAGETKEVTVPLADAPPIARPVTIEVEIEPVPGEEKTDNNSQDFRAIFTRG